MVQFLPPRQANEAGSAWYAILVGVFVSFGGILFGYDTGTISGISGMKYWLHSFADKENNYRLTASQDSLIVSILSAGTFFGALFAAYLPDMIGRRLGLMIGAGLVFNIGVIMQTAADHRPLFVAGRFFAGLGVGLVSAMIKATLITLTAVVPLYQSETAPKWIRGTIVGCYQLSITIGLFLAAIVNNATANRVDSGSFRIPIAVQFAWSLVLVTGLIFLPETPRYLIKKNKPEQAAKALAKLRRLPADDATLREELAEIEANHRYEMSLGQASWADLFKGTILKRLLTGCGLQALQQLTGVNFIFYYGTQYFQNAGFSRPFVIQVITNSVNVVSTLPGLYMVERMGRRNLLLFGAVGMCVCQFIVASVGVSTPADSVPSQRAAIAFVCIYIFFFACSWGPVAWVVTGELFPLKVRAKGLALTTATNWLFNWAIAYATPYMVNPNEANLRSKVFFVWGSCCFVCIAFVYFMIYETKSLTLEQVDEMYATVTKAWQSSKFRPQYRFVDAEREIEQSGTDPRSVSLAHAARRGAGEKGTSDEFAPNALPGTPNTASEQKSREGASAV